MRILVFSDSHGRVGLLRKMIAAEPPPDAIYFLGDGAADFKTIQPDLSGIPTYGHKGNCDGSDCGFPISSLTEQNGVYVLACHGHTRHVKGSVTELMFEAQEKNAKICLYGHTHIPEINYHYGIWFINPGAVLNGRYALIETDVSGKIYPSLKTL